MVSKQFLINAKKGRFLASVLQCEEHLTQNLDTESRSSAYSLFVDKSELMLEVSKAVESYITAFDKSAKCVNSSNLTLTINLTINQ